MSRPDRSTPRRVSRATTSPKDSRAGVLPGSGPSAREARGEGGPVGAIGEGDGAGRPLGTAKDRKLIDASPASERRVSPRTAVRDAMQSARACVPEGFKNLTFCGRTTAKSQVWRSYDPVTRRVSAWISGLATCKLTWACPSCGSAHAYASQKMLERSMQGWRSLGPDHRLALMTLTVRHDLRRPLAESLSVLLRAFTLFANSRTMRRLKKDGTVFGYYRALEITYGATSGWHPHIHVLVFTSDMAALDREWRTEKDGDNVTHGLKVEWGNALNKASEELGVQRRLGAMQRHQDLREASVEDAGRIAGYLTKDGTKWSVAAEMTRLDVKEGRVENQSPRQILVAAGNGDLGALALWHEFVRGTKGVHHIEASYYDFKNRVRITTYLHELAIRQDVREGNIKQGVGDDPRAVANREALDAQDLAFALLSDTEKSEYLRRDLEAEEAAARAERLFGPVASFERSEDLSGKDGRITVEELNRDPRLLHELLATIEATDDPDQAKQVARQFILERGLPLGIGEHRSRVVREKDDSRAGWRERRNLLEVRLMDQGVDEDEIVERLEEFDDTHKPFDRNAFAIKANRRVRASAARAKREKLASEARASALAAVRDAFAAGYRGAGMSEEEIAAFEVEFDNVNADENMSL
ncbi:replication protein [mine drainage metagenome]|uniref:Replication protein n=1 Tax=mine drainage metagenome TaxID=410659 RepID=A0A1J5RJS8_9ZZZZ